ncbi:hypothetical protein HRbin21_01253 [bacterium HR21]|nr:hypothetical protein HRbin21_01253 [bacterium HR21]
MQREVSQEQLREVLETLDVLHLLLAKGRQELQELAPYLLSFGLYWLLNLGSELVFGRGWWAETLLVPFAVATFLHLRLFVTVLVWLGIGMLVGLLRVWVKDPLVTWGMLFAGIGIAMALVYSLAVHQGRFERGKLRLGSRIGIIWGLLSAGAWLMTIIGATQQGTSWELLTALWGYAIGSGLVISGILSPILLVIGLLGIFGIPLAALSFHSLGTVLGISAVMAVGMSTVGFVFLLRGLRAGTQHAYRSFA